MAEDRGRFGRLLDELGLKAPPYATAQSADEALEVAEDVGYPLLVRPSYVLGGRAMEICYSRDDLKRTSTASTQGGEIFLDRFLENSIEVDVDALCDGDDVAIGGVMQHVEEAGIHSGDSACVIPAMSLAPRCSPGRGGHAQARAAARRDRADQRAVRGLGRRRRAVT